MKIKFLSLLLILLFALTICGCKSANIQKPQIEETTQKDELISLIDYRIDNSLGLYNLTDFINDDTQHKLCSYAMYDSDNILLIYRDFSNTSDSFYYFELFNIKTLEKEKLDFKIQISEENSLYFSYYLEVLSVSPLVIYDYVTDTLYNTQNNSVYRIPENLIGGITRYYDDTYYYYFDGTLYTLAEGDEPIEVWTLPKCYSGSYTMLSPDENIFLIEAYTVDPSDPIVYISINLDTYTTTSCTVNGITDDIFLNATSDGRFCTIICDWNMEPLNYSIRILDTKSKTANIISLPDFINKMTFETENQDYSEVKNIYLSEIPLYNNYCIFAMQASDGYLSELYLYDISNYVSKTYDVFEITPYKEPVITYDQLKQRTEKIDELYDITVFFGDDALTEYSNYTSTIENNEYLIDYSLDVLEDSLSLYPEGFFTEMQEAFCSDIVFYLAGPLYTSTPDTSIAEAGAVTYSENGMQIVAFNTEQLSKRNIIHELTHITDNYLIYKDVLLEYEWSELNPEDFYYYYSYVDEYGNEYTYSDDYSYIYTGSESTDSDIYFFDSYSKTFPTEDRARLMEHLLDDPSSYEDFYSNPNVLKKMNCYFSLIRQGFDSDSWDDETCWESCLLLMLNQL